MESTPPTPSTSKKPAGKRWRRRLLWGVGLILMTLAVGFFLFGRLAIETFKVPTNAMAPAIWGRSREVICPQCGYTFQVSASDEIDGRTHRPAGREVVGGICPVCRYPSWGASGGLGAGARPATEGESPRLMRGDRIVAQKLVYRAGDPRRWDIAVFKYPGDTNTVFVKRIVGLPEETVRIHGGDVFVRPGTMGDFVIARKPPEKARAMLLLVHDNDYQPSKALELGWPARWQPDDPDSPGAWQTSSDYRSFETDGSAQGETWLRYRHVVPLPSQWAQIEQGRLPPGEPPAPRLISDFYAGNTDYSTSSFGYGRDPASEYVSPHWVGDLAVQCTMDVRGASGEAVLELVEGGRRMRCRIDVADGSARLSIEGLEAFGPAATTPVRGPGQYELLFANVDDQLFLWIDGALVEFASPTAYDPVNNARPQPADLSPAAIASHGAALAISHVKLLRDVYYIAVGGREMLTAGYGALADFDPSSLPGGRPTPESVARFLSDPDAWGAFDERRAVEFPLGPDQFFVLGDNSAQSKDSRLWPMEGFPYYVSRDLLVGKVVFRYYPRWETVR